MAQYDFFLLGVVSILVGLGLVMIFSASFDQSNRFFDRPTYYFLRQLQWLVVSVVVMLGIALVDFRILEALVAGHHDRDRITPAGRARVRP